MPERITFKTDEMLVIANDRLLAPNTPEARAQFEPLVRQAFGPQAVLTHDSPDPRERLAVRVVNP